MVDSSHENASEHGKSVRGYYCYFRSADKVRSAAWSRSNSQEFKGCCEEIKNSNSILYASRK